MLIFFYVKVQNDEWSPRMHPNPKIRKFCYVSLSTYRRGCFKVIFICIFTQCPKITRSKCMYIVHTTWKRLASFCKLKIWFVIDSPIVLIFNYWEFNSSTLYKYKVTCIFEDNLVAKSSVKDAWLCIFML